MIDAKQITKDDAWDLFLLGAENGGDPGWGGVQSMAEQKAIRENLRAIFEKRWATLAYLSAYNAGAPVPTMNVAPRDHPG